MIPWRGPSICLAGATCYLTQPSLFPTAACSIRPCPGQEWIKSTCQPGPAEGQPPVWWPPLLGRVGWVCRNLVPCRWEQFRLLNVSSGISGKRPFLAKSWPDASQKQPESSWKQSGAIRSSQEPRGAARSSQARSSQDQPDAARSSQKKPGAASRSQEQPGAAKSSQKHPSPGGGPGCTGKGARIPRQKWQDTPAKVPGFRVCTFVIATSVRVITS